MAADDISKYFTREIQCCRDKISLRIKQMCVGDVGCVVWDAALVLAAFLEQETYFPPSFWIGKRVIELGAGTGVVGLAAAAHGANVIITDLPDLVPLMNMNIEENLGVLQGRISAKSLSWGEDVAGFLPAPDVILLADVVYYEEALSNLISTMCELADPNTLLLLSYEERTTGNKPEIERKFIKLIKKYFIVEEIPTSELDPIYRSEDIHVLKLTKSQQQVVQNTQEFTETLKQNSV